MPNAISKLTWRNEQEFPAEQKKETSIIFLIGVFRGRGHLGQDALMTGYSRGVSAGAHYTPLYQIADLLHTSHYNTPLQEDSKSPVKQLPRSIFRCFLSDTDIFMFNYVSSLPERPRYLSFSFEFFESPDRPLENVGARVLDTNSTFFWFEHLPGCSGGWLCNQCVNTPNTHQLRQPGANTLTLASETWPKTCIGSQILSRQKCFE